MKTTCCFQKSGFLIILVLAMSLVLPSGWIVPGMSSAPEKVYARAEEEVPSDWLALAQETIRRKEYQVNWVEEPLIAGAPASFQAPNRAQNLRFYFQPDELQVIQRETNEPAWVWSLALSEVGRAGATTPLKQANLVVEENRVRYQYEVMEQELLNDELGLQQTIVISQKPDARGPGDLVISQQVADGFTLHYLPDGNVKIQFRDEVVLEYGGLNATDASGGMIPVELRVENNALNLIVEDSQAQYPLQVLALLSGVSSLPNWKFAGGQPSANFGYSVATAGDVNGDGYSDVIIGAPNFDFGTGYDGMAAVFYGSPTGLNWVEADWIMDGSEGAQLGTSVATAGDVNGDGYSDVIIGAPEADSGSYTDNGEVYIYRGYSEGLAPGPSWALAGSQSGAALGFSVATAGDLNGDGCSDWVMGAPDYNYTVEDSGAMYVQYGTNSLSGLPEGIAWSDFGEDEYDHLGYSVATAGDVNGDGYADLLVGAPYATTSETSDNDAGKAFLYLGSEITSTRSPFKTFSGEHGGDHLGWSLSTAGDVNGDGYADIIIGAPQADIYTESVTAEGEAYVFYGHPEMDTVKDWYTRGDVEGGKLGWSVATAGDVDSDGYGDVIIGWPYFDETEIALDEGRALLFLGGVTGPGPSLYSDPDNADWIADGNTSNSLFGWSVATGGDVNGDGYSDLLVGAITFTGDFSNEGQAYLYYGGWMNLSNVPGWSDGYDNSPEDPNVLFGQSVASAGDVNGDGYADILIGAPAYDSSYSNGGAAFLYTSDGSTGPSPISNWYVLGSQANALLGWSVASAGDVNGDGYSDVIIGAPYMNNTQDDEGMAFVFLGSASGLGNSTTNPILDADWYAESNWAVSYLGAAVASAGDVNGDGYSDIVIGAPYCDRYTSNSEAGHVLVWYGSASGLGANGTLDNADWRAIGTGTGSHLGNSVSSAGDVNGDGYSDVIASGLLYAVAWYGTHYGLRPITTGYNQDWFIFGPDYTHYEVTSVSGVGDINGDGYSDVAFGCPNYKDSDTHPEEGAVYAYCGSASGLPGFGEDAPSYSCWHDYGNHHHIHLGHSVSGAGDVNGDGYADIIAGAPDYFNLAADEGQVRVYYGALTGPILNSHGDWKVNGGVVANLGISVASAGDTNGDGFADILVGASSYDYDGGKADLYFGNGAPGRPFLLRQLQSDATTNVHNLGGVRDSYFVTVITAFSPSGKSYVRAQSEDKALDYNFYGTMLSQTGIYNTGLTGKELAKFSSLLLTGTSYHWRMRLQYDLVTNPFMPRYSRWMHIPWSGWNEADLRRPAFLIYLPLVRK